MPKRAPIALLLFALIIPISCGTPDEPTAPVETAADLDPDGIRLVVVMVVDQCAAEYLDRFAPLFVGGIDRLRRQGVSFVEAHHEHAITATAVGHATLSTGCFPSRHGIVGNDWYDQETGDRIYAVDDEAFDKSPRNMLSPALGDWLKAANPNSKVFAASGKDRAAIMMGGLEADGAFWYHKKTGTYRTSDYFYAEGEPEWVDGFNHRKLLHRHFGEAWQPLSVSPLQLEEAGIEDIDFGPLHTGFPHVFGVTSPAPERWFYEDSAASPWNDELLALFARRLIEAEDLGMDGAPDLLMLSFSALDWVGHDYGPNSREVLDTLMRLDRQLGDFFSFLDDRVGLDHTLLVFTGDHGVAPVTEYLQARGQTAARASDTDVLCFHQAERLLDERYGEQDWFRPGPFLDQAAVDASGVSREELEQTTAAILTECPGVERIWTRNDLLSGDFDDEPLFTLYRNNYLDGRSPEFMVQFEETFNRTRWSATTHGSAHRHDTHVPLILLAPSLPAGQVYGRVATADMAPTIAAIVGFAPPDALDGRSLVPDLDDVRMMLDEQEVVALEPVALLNESTADEGERTAP